MHSEQNQAFMTPKNDFTKQFEHKHPKVYKNPYLQITFTFLV